MKASSFITKENFNERNIKYGVREFAMAAITNGISLQGQLIPYCGTFFTFSDYMKNAIRLASLMKLKVIYQFTHDSIFLGEDGPTHQPVEHLAALRAMPNITVIRPADSTEVKASWEIALNNNGPTALILTRQVCPEISTTSYEDTKKGAYIVKKETRPQIDISIIATGSEVTIALETATLLENQNQSVRVISMPSWELFEKQTDTYKNSIISEQSAINCVIEAQSELGWHKYVGKNGICITVNTFGKSAPAAALKEEYGFTPTHISQTLLNKTRSIV